jgi:hypothetical protein
VSGVVLVLLMAVAVQLLAWVAAERRAAERRQWALEEAANIMDRITALPWDSLNSDRLSDVARSSQADSVLPEGNLLVELMDMPGEFASKRVVVQVQWQARPGQRVAPVRLTSWVTHWEGIGE